MSADARGEPRDELPTPRVLRRRWVPSLIWLVPLTAVVIGATLVVNAWRTAGPRVTISFQTALGLEVGKTLVKYRNVTVGHVTAISLSSEHNRVLVSGDLLRSAKDLLTADARFWVVRPRIGIGWASGLETLISGSYIAVEAGDAKVRQTEFVGLENPPPSMHGLLGKTVVLHAKDVGSLALDAPVYFRHFEVGHVIDRELEAGAHGAGRRTGTLGRGVHPLRRPGGGDGAARRRAPLCPHALRTVPARSLCRSAGRLRWREHRTGFLGGSRLRRRAPKLPGNRHGADLPPTHGESLRSAGAERHRNERGQDGKTRRTACGPRLARATPYRESAHGPTLHCSGLHPRGPPGEVCGGRAATGDPHGSGERSGAAAEDREHRRQDRSSSHSRDRPASGCGSRRPRRGSPAIADRRTAGGGCSLQFPAHDAGNGRPCVGRRCSVA